MDDQKNEKGFTIQPAFLKDVLWLCIQIGAIILWAGSVNSSLMVIKEKLQDQKQLIESNDAELKERIRDLENCVNKGRC